MRRFLAAFVIFSSAAAPAMSGSIEIEDAYVRSGNRISGAAFMTLTNTATTDDRLIAARSPVAERVELHTHLEDPAGVMRMVEVEDGFAVPAGGRHQLARGGDHIMFLGLLQPLQEGGSVPVTLSFEHAGEITVELTVDNARSPAGGSAGHHGHDMAPRN